MLDKNNIRNIKTENLYLAAIQMCKNKDSKYTYFSKDYDLILVRKIERCLSNYYQDIFTKTLYDVDNYDYDVGKVYIRGAYPIISNLKYISFNEATYLINNKKNKFFEDTNSINENDYEMGFFGNNGFQFKKK